MITINAQAFAQKAQEIKREAIEKFNNAVELFLNEEIEKTFSLLDCGQMRDEYVQKQIFFIAIPRECQEKYGDYFVTVCKEKLTEAGFSIKNDDNALLTVTY